MTMRSDAGRRGTGRGPRGERADVMELLAMARPAALDEPHRTPAATLVAGRAEGTAILQVPGRGPRRTGLRLAGAGLAVAAAVALAVAVATAGHRRPAGPPVRTSRSPVAAPSASAILLTAAVRAAGQPAAGRYWRVELKSANVWPSGPNAHPYAVEERYRPEVTWYARSASQRTWTFPSTGYRSIPATAGAAAAWRADGSPPLPAKRYPRQAFSQRGGKVGYFGNGSLTVAQYLALPSDPGALAAAVRRAALAQYSIQPGRAGLAAGMFGVYGQLLTWDPITPRVRAAVYRDIARLPGVRSTGKVTDPLGRSGYGVAITDPKAGGRDEEVLVIAPRAGRLLAAEFLITGPPDGANPSASGARPGLTSCPADGVPEPGKKGSCIVGTGKKAVLLSLGPRLALAPGHIGSYYAVVRASWTNAAPPLPPASQRGSQAGNSKG